MHRYSSWLVMVSLVIPSSRLIMEDIGYSTLQWNKTIPILVQFHNFLQQQQVP